jgi:hypothetical protein
MNYERALATLNHARTGRQLPRKKLMNATWLHTVLQHDSSDQCVSLSLFDKHILMWKPNGNIVLTSAGYPTWSTKDRFARYLPWGFRVWQERPFWYVSTPSGTRPFFDGMELRPDGSVVQLSGALNAVDARTLGDDVYQYAQFYAARLVNGVSARDVENTCSGCVAVNLLPDLAEVHKYGQFQQHLLKHMQQETTPPNLILAAVDKVPVFARVFRARTHGESSRSFLRQVIDASWHENQKAWRKPTTKKALVEQTGLLMTRENLPRLDIIPRKYIVSLRMLVEDFLLESFQFM